MSAARTVPGAISQVRSTALAWPKASKPASAAACAADASNPAATNTSTKPVMRKKRERLIRTPPL